MIGNAANVRRFAVTFAVGGNEDCTRAMAASTSWSVRSMSLLPVEEKDCSRELAYFQLHAVIAVEEEQGMARFAGSCGCIAHRSRLRNRTLKLPVRTVRPVPGQQRLCGGGFRCRSNFRGIKALHPGGRLSGFSTAPRSTCMEAGCRKVFIQTYRRSRPQEPPCRHQPDESSTSPST